MPDVIDLGLLGKDDPEPPERPKDLSGKPAPVGVTAVLENGFRVKCDVRYDGIDDVGWRRYAVFAEWDWDRHWIDALEVEEMATDISLIFKFPDEYKASETFKRSGAVDLRVKKIINIAHGGFAYVPGPGAMPI